MSVVVSLAKRRIRDRLAAGEIDDYAAAFLLAMGSTGVRQEIEFSSHRLLFALRGSGDVVPWRKK